MGNLLQEIRRNENHLFTRDQLSERIELIGKQDSYFLDKILKEPQYNMLEKGLATWYLGLFDKSSFPSSHLGYLLISSLVVDSYMEGLEVNMSEDTKLMKLIHNSMSGCVLDGQIKAFLNIPNAELKESELKVKKLYNKVFDSLDITTI